MTETVELDALKLDPKNSRVHDKKNLRAIRVSLEEFGQVLPLVVQRSSGMLVGGNARLVVMREMGMTQCEIVYVDEDDDRSRALSIALNRTGELARWDFSALADVMEKVTFDWESLGWGKGNDENNAPTTDDSAPLVRYLIEITCEDEKQQVRTLQTLRDQGIDCRPVIT